MAPVMGAPRCHGWVGRCGRGPSRSSSRRVRYGRSGVVDLCPDHTRKPMSDDSHSPEAEFITAAYAEKVKEAFIGFAENLNVGQPEKSCTERFLRSMAMIKKARDLALVA